MILNSKKTSTDYLNYMFILYAFVVPLSRAGIVLSTALLLILWVVEGDFKRKFRQIIESKFIIAITLFMLFSTLSLLWVEQHNLVKALSYLRKYWYLLAILPIFTSLKPSYIPKLLYAFLAGMTIHLILSWAIYTEIWKIEALDKNHFSPFMYHVIYSVYLAFSALISLSFAFVKQDKLEKWVFIILSILFIITLFSGIGRTGQVVFVVGAFVLAIIHSKEKIKMIVALFLISFLTLGTLYLTNDNFKERINFVGSDIDQISHKKYCNSLGGRLFTWELTSEIFDNSPILGLGIGDHLEYLNNALENDKRFRDCGFKNTIKYFHGQYIEIITQGGILGLTLFILIFYFLTKIKLQQILINNIKIILIITFLLVFIVDMPFRRQFALALFALMSAIVLVQKRAEDEI